jgi:hypothetical protein
VPGRWPAAGHPLAAPGALPARPLQVSPAAAPAPAHPPSARLAPLLPRSLTATEDILELLKLPVMVVLDEAYIEFSSEGSKMAWVQQHPNLVVLRTFSKSAALAGLRVRPGCV